MFAASDPSQFMVKVCGITSLADARHSIEYGANALGLNFYPPSPRYIEPEKAEQISREIGGRVLTMGVVVIGADEALETLQRISRKAPSLGAFQLHGLEAESQVPAFEKTCYVATSVDRAQAFPNNAIIIDSSWYREKADWERLRGLDRPFILSGGLTPENVSSAIRLLDPAGVDVCSGVESSPGVKDWAKVEVFLESVHGALAG